MDKTQNFLFPNFNNNPFLQQYLTMSNINNYPNNQYNNMNFNLMNQNFNQFNQNNMNFNNQMNMNNQMQFMNMNNQIQFLNMMMDQIQFMNMNMGQMNQMMKSSSNNQQPKGPEDIYPYIKEDKKNIIFITSDVRIPYKYRNDYTFLDNGLTLNVNSDKYLGNIFKDLEKITIVELKKSIVNWIPGPGKLLKFTLVNDNNNNDIIIKAEVGTLEQIKDFYNKVKSEIKTFLTSKGNKLLENPRIYPGGIEVKENDERTFSSIGIRDNFICKVKL